MRLSDCHNIDDFRVLAKARLPFPVFDYIDGAADDELTKARNTAAFAEVDLVPDVLAGVAEIDTSCTILGRKSALPLMLSPTAVQRAFHWQGERAVAKAAEKYGLWFGISSLATRSIEEIAALTRWSPSKSVPIVRMRRGTESTADTQKRRVKSASSGLGGVWAVITAGSSAMPQIGQAPGPTCLISGCIGQV